MSWELKERQAGPVTVVNVIGRLTMGAGSEALDEKLTSLVAAGRVSLLLDCSRVDAVDSQGLKSILRGIALAREKGGHLKLLKPSPRLREVLKVTRLTTVTENFDDEDAALRSFQT